MSTHHAFGFERPARWSPVPQWRSWRVSCSPAAWRRGWNRACQQLVARRTIVIAATLIAAVWLTLGLVALVQLTREQTHDYRAAATVCLLIAVAWQARLVWLVARERNFHGLELAALFAVCKGAGFVLALAFFVAAVCHTSSAMVPVAVIAWGWSIALALVATSRGRVLLKPHTSTRVRKLVSLGFAACSVVVVSEGLCWLLDRAAGVEPFSYVALQQAKFAPGSTVGGSTINDWGYRGDSFHTDSPREALRVAVLGSPVALAGSEGVNALRQIESRVPGVELYNFALPGLTPAEYAAQFERDIARCRPDVVVVFVQAGDDLLRSVSPAASFDWRSLRLAQWSQQAMPLAWLATNDTAAQPTLSAEQQLRSGAQQLATCRTPLDAVQRRQWSALKGDLQALAERCQRHEVALAMVLVPCEFQVSLPLRETLVRRAGIESTRFDFELPQRQFERLAQEQQVAAIDLLPHFRSAKASSFARERNELSPAGSAIVAQVLGGWLESRYGKQIASRHATMASDALRR